MILHSNKGIALLFLTFIILAAAGGGVGYFFYDRQKMLFMQEKYRSLASISDLKAGQIDRWRKERIGDGGIIQESPFIGSHVRTFLQKPEEPRGRQEILEWMQSLERHYHYEESYLFDAQGRMILCSNEGKKKEHPGAYIRALAVEAMQKVTVVLSDIYRIGKTGEICLTLIVPVFFHQAYDLVPMGFFLLQIDPHHFLFPFIQTWPGESQSAETLLVRREGNEVVYLNELRHRKDTALQLRLPAGEKELPAAKAVRGEEEVFEGIDYRGKPVLASVKRIPDSPWFMVAKEDKEEAFAPLRSKNLYFAFLGGVLVLGAGLSLAFYWRVERLRLEKERYKAELERQLLEKRFEFLTRYANDIVLLMDEEMRIQEANERGVQTYGYTRDELCRMRLEDLRAPETREDLGRQMGEVKRRNGYSFESIHQRKDGTPLLVENSSRLIETEGGKFYQSIIRDVTQRKQMEKALQKSEEEARIAARENEIVAEIGRIISSDLRIEEVYDRFAEQVGKVLSFNRIAIIIVNFESDTFTIPYVSGGTVEERGMGMTFPLAGMATQRVMDTGKGMVIQGKDWEEQMALLPGIKPVYQSGYRSYITVPLISKEKVFGALVIQSQEENAYRQEDFLLAQKVGIQIAGAISNALLYAQLKEAEEAIQKTAVKNEAIAEMGRIISSTENIDEVYERFAEEARKLIVFDKISINAADPAANTVTLLYASGRSIAERNARDVFPLGGSLTERVVRTKEGTTFHPRDEEEVASCFPGILPVYQSGLRSIMMVPLISKDRVIGTLAFMAAQPNAYTADSLQAGGKIANQISGAIDLAEIYALQRRSEEIIRSSLREKEVMLKEIHHRVKNNLQVISSLLRLQGQDLQNEAARQAIEESQNRVRAMALVHEKLYQARDLAQVDAGEIYLGVDVAIPCGLLVNELVTNALKHGFPEGRRGAIGVSLGREGDRMVLRIWDDGVGIPEGFDYRKSKSLGMQLVVTLVQQLDGEIELVRQGGTRFQITFPGVTKKNS